jgi:hypothetical protein
MKRTLLYAASAIALLANPLNIIKFTIGSVLIVGILFSTEMTSAAPIALQPTPGVSSLAGTFVEKAKTNYCGYWLSRCAQKSWDRRSYRYCLMEHGC